MLSHLNDRSLAVLGVYRGKKLLDSSYSRVWGAYRFEWAQQPTLSVDDDISIPMNKKSTVFRRNELWYAAEYQTVATKFGRLGESEKERNKWSKRCPAEKRKTLAICKVELTKSGELPAALQFQTRQRASIRRQTCWPIIGSGCALLFLASINFGVGIICPPAAAMSSCPQTSDCSACCTFTESDMSIRHYGGW